MPKYEVTDPATGKTVELTGDSPPTEQELEQVFSAIKTEPAKPSFLQRFEKGTIDKLPLLGGIAGGIVGTVGGPLGSVGGATLGGAAGESLKQIGRRTRGMDVPQTSTEAAKQIGIEGGIQGASELVGIGVGKLLKPLARPVGKGLAKMGQAIAGVPARQFERLSADPLAVFARSKEAAGRQLGEVLEKEGISTLPKAETLFDPQLSQARETASAVYNKMAKAEPVTAEEVYQGKQAVSRILAATGHKDKGTFRALTIVKKQLDDKLGELSGPAQKASAQYARSSLASDFRTPIAMTNTGEYSKLRNVIAPLALGGSGLISGQGKERSGLGAAGVIAAQSPILAGSLTAIGSGIGKMATSPLGSRAVINPMVNMIVKGLLERKAKREAEAKQSSVGK